MKEWREARLRELDARHGAFAVAWDKSVDPDKEDFCGLYRRVKKGVLSTPDTCGAYVKEAMEKQIAADMKALENMRREAARWDALGELKKLSAEQWARLLAIIEERNEESIRQWARDMACI